MIQTEKVPDIIQGKTVYSLSMGALVSGTKYRGEFEERIEKLLRFIKKKERDLILFIDELHLLIGAGKTDGAMDAANLLKPALARGELNCIGATTLYKISRLDNFSYEAIAFKYCLCINLSLSNKLSDTGFL